MPCSPAPCATPCTTRPAPCAAPQVAKEHPGVSIGSYPNTASGGAEADTFKVKLAFTSRDAAALAAALEAAKAALPRTFEMA